MAENTIYELIASELCHLFSPECLTLLSAICCYSSLFSDLILWAPHEREGRL